MCPAGHTKVAKGYMVDIFLSFCLLIKLFLVNDSLMSMLTVSIAVCSQGKEKVKPAGR